MTADRDAEDVARARILAAGHASWDAAVRANCACAAARAPCSWCTDECCSEEAFARATEGVDYLAVTRAMAGGLTC